MDFWALLGAGLLVGLVHDCAAATGSGDVAEDDGSEHEHVAREVSFEAASRGDVARREAPPPGTRYVSLTGEACAVELASRGIAYEALSEPSTVTSPVRLHGPLSGVWFRTLWPEPKRAQKPFEIIDCRLVLALDDFAKRLRARGIVEAILFSAYRPQPWSRSEHVPGPHATGLAIDIAYFRKEDGDALNVERDFLPRPRERICRNKPPPRDATQEAVELRQIACEASSSRLFHVTLTPAYDSAHHDHFHFELTSDRTDFVAR